MSEIATADPRAGSGVPRGPSGLLHWARGCRQAPAKLVVHLEHFGRAARTVELDGKPLAAPAALPGNRPAAVRIEFE